MSRSPPGRVGRDSRLQEGTACADQGLGEVAEGERGKETCGAEAGHDEVCCEVTSERKVG